MAAPLTWRPLEPKIMCRRVTCSACAKPTYAGCGAHIEHVLGDVPKDKRCTCRQREGVGRPTSATTAWWPFGSNKGGSEVAK